MSGSVSQSSAGTGGVNIAAGRDVEIEVAGDFVGGNKTVNTRKYIENQTIVQVTDIEQLPPAEPDAQPPYKGLDYFTEADAHRFYGRDTATAVLVNRLKERHILAVIGASGSGKSSLVRAGLIPVIKEDKQLSDGTQPLEGSWQVHKLTPTDQPLQNLAVTLFPHDSAQQTELIAQATQTAAALQKLIPALPKLDQDDPEVQKLLDMAAMFQNNEQMLAGIRAKVQELSSQKTQNHLLLIDQFEEIFTLCKSEPERAAFIDNLLQAAQAEFKIVLTMRADFYAHCLKYESLRQLLKEAQEPIGAMTPDELAEAILEPAKQNNWQLQQGLVELMLDDVGQEPGALPLLSHALLETWKNRRGRTMTLSGYKQAGGVKGAIAKTAEQVYTHLTPDQQTIARRIFIALTELGENGTQDTRRRADLTEIGTAETIQGVLHQLADARLITLHTDTVDVAHEALIRGWPRLQEWLADDREQVRFERQLQRDAEEWDARGRETGSLYRGSRLSQITELQDTLVKQDGLRKEFVQASLDNHRDELQKALQDRDIAQAQLLLVTPTTILADKQNLTHPKAELVLLMIIQALKLTTKHNLNTISQSFVREQLSRVIEDVDWLHFLGVKTSTTTSEQDDTLEALSGLSSKPITLFDHTGSVRAVAFSSNGKFLASAGSDKIVKIWNLNELNVPPKNLINHSREIASIAFSANGESLASTDSSNVIRLWSFVSLNSEPELLIGHSSTVRSLAFAPNSQLLASASYDKTIALWDIGNSIKEPVILNAHDKGVYAVAFSPDGKRLASAGFDETILLWDLSVSPPSHKIIKTKADITRSLSFSPDSKMLAASGPNSTIYIWNLSNLTLAPRIFYGHNENILSVKFSPDSMSLASASQDRTIRIWDVTNPKANPTILSGHSDWVGSIDFSPNGQFLASASGDRTVCIWPTLQRLINIANRLVKRNFTLEEWRQYFDTQPYERTCPQYPPHPTVPESEWPEEYRQQLAQEKQLSEQT